MLVAELADAGIQRLIDVRIRPQSRRPGMSKTKLGLRLAEHGIAYEHWRELGTPVEIRAIYRSGATATAATAFRAHLTTDPTAGAALQRLLSSLQEGPPTALLCLESEPAHCHRRVISQELAALDGDLTVIDL